MLQGSLHSIRFSLLLLLRWWCTELLALVPAPWRRFWGRRREYWVQVDERCRLYRAGELAAGPLAPQAVSPEQCVLLLTPHACIRRQVEFPRSVEANLAQVLGYELDRLTPLRPEQAYFDYRILVRDTERQRVTVELLLCPRERLDRQLARLAAEGLRPQRITCLDDAGRALLPFNLLPDDRRGSSWQLRRVLNALLAALLLGLLVAWQLQPLQAIEAEIQALQPALSKARADAEAVQQLQRQITELEQGGAFLEAKRRSPQPLALLRELSLILPDDTWLQQLQLRQNAVLLQGQSPAAAQVVQLLESSPLLRQVSFRSPVVRDPRSGRESFYLAAQVPGGAP